MTSDCTPEIKHQLLQAAGHSYCWNCGYSLGAIRDGIPDLEDKITELENEAVAWKGKYSDAEDIIAELKKHGAGLIDQLDSRKNCQCRSWTKCSYCAMKKLI